MELNIKQINPCQKRSLFDRLNSSEDSWRLELGKSMKLLCSCIAKQDPVAEVIDNMSFPIKGFKSDMERKSLESDYKGYLKRFVSFLKQEFPSELYEAVLPYRKLYTELKVPFREGVQGVYSTPHLVMVPKKEGGKPILLYLLRANSSCSERARTEENRTDNYLPFLVGKLSYDGSYPGCLVASFALKASKNDSPEAPAVQNGTASSNFKVVSYENTVGGDFLLSELSDRLQRLVDNISQKDMGCYMCPHKEICGSSGVSLREHVNTIKPQVQHSSSVYQLPEFTQEQTVAVNHKDGPLLVVAGPGSGKTAVLVGRTMHLLASGVEPENILLVTFSKKAAKEIEERLFVLSPVAENVTVGTIHSLCYQIIRNNSEQVFGSNRYVKCVPPVEQKQLVLSLLEEFEKPLNINMENITYGVKKVCDALNAMQLVCTDATAMEQVERRYKLGENFIEFYHFYKEFAEKGGLVTYDQLISLCGKLLRENQMLRQMYQRIYRYVMVDEFQDIDAEQYEIIRLLSEHGNLAVAGDDDQSIYGFRGGSPEYMQRFQMEYPSATVAEISGNFRTPKEILSVADNVISQCGNRLAKDIKATKKGRPPVFHQDNDLAGLIESKIQEGYSYGDIAVLARKNETLLNISKALPVPCYLAKVNVSDDVVANFIYHILGLFYEGVESNEHLLPYLFAFGCSVDNLPFDAEYASHGLYQSLMDERPDLKRILLSPESFNPQEQEADMFSEIFLFLAECFNELLEGIPATDFIHEVFHALGVDNAASLPALLEMVETLDDESLVDTKTLYLHLKALKEWGESENMEVANENAVALYTTHSSKGKEFPVVIMVDCEAYDSDKDEDLRLFYVGMTRAKTELHLLSSDYSKCSIRAFAS